MSYLLTSRLVLRRFRDEDWLDLQAYVADPEVTKFEPEYPSDEAGCRSLAAFFATSSDFWAVQLQTHDNVIGHIHCGLKEPANLCTYNLGFVFNPQFQHQGYATEACRCLVDYAFMVLGARRFESGCSPENEPSWHLLERLGMRREAHHLQNVSFRTRTDGSPIITDSFVYALLRDEWLRANEG